jgi:lipoate-protein ligase A
MALDAWLLAQHDQGLSPPVLRFYTWSPPAISLGYHQRRWPQAWDHLIWQGQKVDLVRRPTGGRAVLHQGDLTYMVIMSGLAGSRIQAYQTICEFLVQGWRSLGVQLNYGQAGRGYIHNSNCFGTATGADLVLENGSKLIGSAQLRRRTTLLQHGSMLLEPDLDLFTQVFGSEFSVLACQLLPLRGEALFQIVMEALASAASHCFGVKFVEQPLSASEWQAVAQSTETLVDGSCASRSAEDGSAIA